MNKIETQSDQSRFQNKKIKDQPEEIRKQSELIKKMFK